MSAASPDRAVPQNVPRVALTREESAASLGMSLSSFVRHVAPDVPTIRRGSIRLYRLAALEEWAQQNEDRTL